MKTKQDELLDLYALWANCTDDIEYIIDDVSRPIDDTPCAQPLTSSEGSDDLTDIPF